MSAPKVKSPLHELFVPVSIERAPNGSRCEVCGRDGKGQGGGVWKVGDRLMHLGCEVGSKESEATYRATIRACELVGEGYTSSLARQVARECRDAVDAAWSQRVASKAVQS